jgi:glycosyltransferase involved in cell wall biosynthesis
MSFSVENKNDVFLSIIIPVYNTEQYLNRCLDSVIKSVDGVSNIEIIVVNDGSPGNVNEIMKYYLKEYDNIIKYYIKENAGLADTKNFGLEKSTGKYVTFVDSDDFVDEDYYRDAIRIIENDSCDVLVCDFETCKNENEKFRTHAKNPSIRDDKWGCIDISIMPSSCNKVVKKDLYGDLKYPSGLVYEDLATTLILLFRAEKIVYIPKMYYKYCIRENSIMRESFNENKFKIIDILEILFSRLENLNITNMDKDRAKNSVCYDRIYFELLEPLSKETFKNRYKLAKKLCKKIKCFINNLNDNEYYKKELKTGRIKKKIYSKLVNFALCNNFPLFLCKILDKAVYYNNQYMRDKWRNMEESNE